jgi:hypothetical protein
MMRLSQLQHPPKLQRAPYFRYFQKIINKLA